METLAPILRGHVFFKDLELQFIELIVGCASNRRYCKDSYLCK